MDTAIDGLNFIDTKLLQTEKELIELLLSKASYEQTDTIKTKDTELTSNVSNISYDRFYSLQTDLEPALKRLEKLECIKNFSFEITNSPFKSGSLTLTIVKPQIIDYFSKINEELSKRISKPEEEPYVFNKNSFEMKTSKGEVKVINFNKNEEEKFLFMCLFNAWRENKGVSISEITEFISKKYQELPESKIKTIKANLIKKINSNQNSEFITISDYQNGEYKLELKP